MSDMKNDSNKQQSNQNKGSGSDTASAAKISAGTSVGNVGQSPMPHSQQGSGSGAGAGSGLSAQGGPASGSQPMRSSGGSTTGGATETIKDAAQNVGETARQTAEQVQEKAGQAYDQASEWASDTYERANSWASDNLNSEQMSRARSRSMQGMRGAGRGVQQYVAENPVMVGLVGLAAGLLIGALLPRTRREDETLGEWADEVRQQGMRYARDMTQRGREFLEENLGEDPRFARHESEFGQGQGQQGGANRH
jgi:ElaB/YqjD/DUF883 family membrane-anchored ribosome-binding protein